MGLITQNISSLHIKAGSKKVFEIHGSMREKRNLISGKFRKIPDSWTKKRLKKESFINWRPNVCFIGESYDKFPIKESLELCCSCQILIIIGTSGIIHTPVLLAEISRKSGAIILNINPNKGILDEVSNFVFRGKASEYFRFKID